MKNVKRALSLVLAVLLLLPASVFVSASEAVTITPAKASGSLVDNVGSLTFTFSKPMNPATVLAGVTFAEKNSKYVSATTYTDLLEWNPRNVDMTLDSTNQILTLTFAEGDLAANAEYKVTFADTVLAADNTSLAAETLKVYTYRTKKAEGDYYTVNENFDRYPARMYTYGERLHYGAFVPFTRFRGYMAQFSGMVTTGGDQGFQITARALANPESQSVGYDNSYAASLPSGQYTYTSAVETVASFSGNQTGTYEIGGALIIRTDGTLSGSTVTYDTNGTVGLYARRTGTTGTGDNAANESYANMTRLATLSNVVNSGRKHTIKYIATTTLNSETGMPTARKLHEVYIDGTKVVTDAIPAEGLSLTTQHNSQGVFVNTGTETRAFCVSNASSETESTMTVYSFKHSLLDAVDKITVENHPQATVGGNITIAFNDDPKVTTTCDCVGTPCPDNTTHELKNQITITKVGGSSAGLSLEPVGGYNTTNHKIVLKPVGLEHNAQYTVTMPAREYTFSGLGAAKSLTFTTGWAKLTASSTNTDAVTSSGFAPTVTVTNITSQPMTYDAMLVLYRREGGVVNQVDCETLTRTALAVEDDETFTFPAVADPNPSGSATYYAKAFFVADGEAVSEPIVFGTAAGAITPEDITGNVSELNLTADENAGRIDGNGEYTGLLPDRAIWVTVTAPSGAVVFCDQLSSGDAGNFAFGFNLLFSRNTERGTYTATAKPSTDGKTAVTKTISLLFASVTPSVVSIDLVDETGAPVRTNTTFGKTLTVEYTVSDMLERESYGAISQVRWYTSATADGAGSTLVSAGTTTDFTLTDACAGKYIFFSVVPMVYEDQTAADAGDATRVVQGTERFCNVGLVPADTVIAPVYVQSKPAVKNVSLTQSGNNVTLSYEVYDPAAQHTIPTPNREVKWYIDGVEITGYELSDAYPVTAADAGKTISAEVTPLMNVDTCPQEEACLDFARGDMVAATPITMTYTAGSLESGFGGGSGGGGGGGGSATGTATKPIEGQSPVVEQVPEDTENTTSGTLDFTDVRDHWAATEIYELYDKGVIKGRTETEFDPNGKITRAEFLAIMVRALGLDNATYAGSFADAKAGDWYADVLQAARNNGLFEGSDGYAHPNRPITREEMTTIVVRAYEKYCGEIIVPGGLLGYKDGAKISRWAHEAVTKATEISLVNGMADGTFAPHNNTTRAEGAVIITRLLPHIEKAIAEKLAAEEAAKAETATEE